MESHKKKYIYWRYHFCDTNKKKIIFRIKKKEYSKSEEDQLLLFPDETRSHLKQN